MLRTIIHVRLRCAAARGWRLALRSAMGRSLPATLSAAYCDFLQTRGKKVSDAGWKLLVGAVGAEFDSLRSRNHSPVARRDFVEKLQIWLASDFVDFNRKAVKATSNLDWDKLDQNFQILDFDLGRFQEYRNRLHKEVVGWRHGVAHCDAPNLGSLHSSQHISLVREVMTLVAEVFQKAMLAHL